MQDEFIGSTFPTPKGGVITVIGHNGLVGDKSKYICDCSICKEDKDLYPEKFLSPKKSLMSGSIPCGCSTRVVWKGYQVDVLLERKCKVYGYDYLGFVGDYIGVDKTAFKFLCPKHGVQERKFYEFYHKGDKFLCSDCKKEEFLSRRTNQAERLENIKRICVDKGYEFCGFIGGKYKNTYTKFKFKCPEHGYKIKTYNDFVNAGQYCPSCSKSGYCTDKPGSFYIYKYKIFGYEEFYKFGITNRDVSIRSKEHIRGCDVINFECVYSKTYKDGKIPKTIESHIMEIEPVGVVDCLHSGNTETIWGENIERIINICETF